MMRKIIIACVLGSVPVIAHAQTAYRVDPQTGNYVPVKDSFVRDDPDENQSNPNRLNNRVQARQSPRVGGRVAGAAVNQASTLTPAQQMAAKASDNGQAAAASPLPGQAMDSQGLVSLGDMAMYSSPGSADQDNSPFAKPDWWPQ